MKDRFILVYTTVGSLRDARRIARHLLKKRYIACANIFPLSSLYWWQGKIEKAKEFGIFLKTTEERYQEIESTLKEIHPYELPCIISFNLLKGERRYLEWIEKEVR